jgi:hypothetical protein
MTVRVTPGGFKEPVELFVADRQFVGARPDGQQFLFNKFIETPVSITVLLNWKPPLR